MSKYPKSNPPKISVVIPSFNAQKFIGETLKSIFNQNYPNLEVIIQDGGSKDGTVEIIKEYANKYPEMIKWESKKDKGQADAINKGLDKAYGEILTYINTDDIYSRNTFSLIAEAYSENKKALWFAGKGRVIDGSGNEVVRAVSFYKDTLLKLNSYSILLMNNYLMQPSVFFTRRAYKIVGNFTDTEGIVMEYDAWLKLGQIDMPLVLDSVLSSFRMSGTNISSKMFNKTIDMDEKIVRKYTKNALILFFHKLNNIGRIGVVQSFGKQ